MVTVSMKFVFELNCNITVTCEHQFEYICCINENVAYIAEPPELN
jgi:hypothetical protein